MKPDMMMLLTVFALALIPVGMLASVALKMAGREMAYNALVPPATALAPPYGALIYFALDGDTVETETVSVEDAPAGAVLDDWKEMGCIDSGEVVVNKDGGETIHCFNSTSGKHEPLEVVGETTSLTYNFTVQKVTPFILQMSRHAASMNASTGAIAPNSQASGTYKGYLLVTQYNGTEQVVTDLLRAELSLANAMPIHSRTAVKPQLTARIVDNVNNASALGTVTA